MNAELICMQGDIIDEPFVAKDQGHCCSACLEQARAQVTSREMEQMCNFWWAHKEAASMCLLTMHDRQYVSQLQVFSLVKS